ncbi:MurR/RpiR family transcriptional regulator [Bacillus cereus]|uniref:MurR/RpiR family transcriptional regulator n=1 Tax=Bacillus cereus group sp. BfR-BA-01524 TaxID=2920372 RepID=UPI001F57D90B|nr:MurR/RpiR family transcriptional regulator [Bacillus cereus]MED2868314.1 MurR/RpiR family transcriptional regulator [Bacillus thuringiensis]MED3323744.1 MurR/RpiR family transcriptional regulator [Bacillus thuringiensis]
MPGTRSGIGKIQASLNGLSPKLRSIAEHILKHPQDVVHKSITELAEVTNSSEATIFRLCKHLGLQGFQDLKITLAREIVHTPMQNIHEEVSAEDSMVTVAKKVFHSHITGLQDTLHLLNETALEQAVRALQEASRIEFYGNGGSGIIAMDAYHKFMRTGISCIAHTDSHFQIMGAGLLSGNSVVIGISHSGSNKGLLEALEVAKARGAKIIAITSYKKSALSQLADITLYTSTRETEFRTEASSSRLAQLSLLDTLYVGVSLQRQEETLKNLQSIRETISMKRI